MSKFSYETYIITIKGLAYLPYEHKLIQEKFQTSLMTKMQQVENTTKLHIDELEKTEKFAYQQFDDIAFEYKVLFSTPVSRPKPLPTPLSLKDTLSAQNVLALHLQTYFDKAKQMAVANKRMQIEVEKAEQARLVALKLQEEENKRRMAEEAEHQREEEYRRELERASRSTFKKFLDFLTGQ